MDVVRTVGLCDGCLHNCTAQGSVKTPQRARRKEPYCDGRRGRPLLSSLTIEERAECERYKSPEPD
jgi:hypothetical protein